MGLDHRLLAAFDAVAEHGSVGRAAAALNATQPTVSRQIHLLELQIGNELFDRDPRGMHLTPAGADLLPHARHILHEMKLAREMMDAHRGLHRGSIRIGAVESVVRSKLPPVLAEVVRRAPHLSLELLVGSEEQLDRALADRSIDVMFATQEPRAVRSLGLGSRTFEDRCVVFCSANHPLATSGRTAADKVIAQRWALGHRGATTRLQFEELVRQAGLDAPAITVQTDSVDTIMALVASGDILGWLPEPIINASPLRSAVATLEVPELELTRTFRAYRRAHGTFPPAGQILLDALAHVSGHALF